MNDELTSKSPREPLARLHRRFATCLDGRESKGRKPQCREAGAAPWLTIVPLRTHCLYSYIDITQTRYVNGSMQPAQRRVSLSATLHPGLFYGSMPSPTLYSLYIALVFLHLCICIFKYRHVCVCIDSLFSREALLLARLLCTRVTARPCIKSLLSLRITAAPALTHLSPPPTKRSLDQGALTFFANKSFGEARRFGD